MERVRGRFQTIVGKANVVGRTNLGKTQWFAAGHSVAAFRAATAPLCQMSCFGCSSKVASVGKPLALFSSKRLHSVEHKVDADGFRPRVRIKGRIVIEQDLPVSATGSMIASVCGNLDSNQTWLTLVARGTIGGSTAAG